MQNFCSAEGGHLEVVKVLMEVGGRELLMLTADEGVSWLMVSAQDGHVEVAKALFSYQVDPTAV